VLLLDVEFSVMCHSEAGLKEQLILETVEPVVELL
jgi:hypothetical protein